MLLIAIAISFAVGTFLLVCALSLRLSAAEKIGLGIGLVGLLAQVAISAHLASVTYTGEGLADWDIASRALGQWLFLASAAGVTVCIGAVLVVGSAGWRSWCQRRKLFPFFYRTRQTA